MINDMHKKMNDDPTLTTPRDFCVVAAVCTTMVRNCLSRREGLGFISLLLRNYVFVFHASRG